MVIKKKSLTGVTPAKAKPPHGTSSKRDGVKPAEPARLTAARKLAMAKLATAKLSTARLAFKPPDK